MQAFLYFFPYLFFRTNPLCNLFVQLAFIQSSYRIHCKLHFLKHSYPYHTRFMIFLQSAKVRIPQGMHIVPAQAINSRKRGAIHAAT